MKYFLLLLAVMGAGMAITTPRLKYTFANAGDGYISTPNGLAFSTTHIYVSDPLYNRVFYFDYIGLYVSQFEIVDAVLPPGSYEIGLGSITIRNTTLYVCNNKLYTIDKYTLNGIFIGRISYLVLDETAGASYHIIVTGDRIYLNDSLNSKIKVFQSDGVFLFSIVSNGFHGLDIDIDGNIYICQWIYPNWTIAKYSPAGVFIDSFIPTSPFGKFDFALIDSQFQTIVSFSSILPDFHIIAQLVNTVDPPWNFIPEYYWRSYQSRLPCCRYYNNLIYLTYPGRVAVFEFIPLQLSAPIDQRFGLQHCVYEISGALTYARRLVSGNYGVIASTGAGELPSLRVAPDRSLDLELQDATTGALIRRVSL